MITARNDWNLGPLAPAIGPMQQEPAISVVLSTHGVRVITIHCLYSRSTL
jgi:hypothetical protein